MFEDFGYNEFSLHLRDVEPTPKAGPVGRFVDVCWDREAARNARMTLPRSR